MDNTVELIVSICFGIICIFCTIGFICGCCLCFYKFCGSRTRDEPLLAETGGNITMVVQQN